MIYDCFSFFNELDILEIRLNTLNDVVDRFVLVEATKTHTGHPKPLYFEENKTRFAPFLDKIIHIIVDDYPEPPADYTIEERAWVRENHQRNAIARGLRDAKPDDILTITDADEIPSPEVIKWYKGRHGLWTMKQKLFAYYLNLRNYSHPFWGDCSYGPKILTFGDFINPQAYYRVTRSPRLDFINRGPTATNIRSAYAPRASIPGGWHFTYIGNITHIQNKLKSFAEVCVATEANLSAETIRKRISAGEDILGNGDRHFFIELDDSFPIYLVNHASQYKSLLNLDKTQSSFIARIKLVRAYAGGIFRDIFENRIKAPCRPLYNPIKKILGI